MAELTTQQIKKLNKLRRLARVIDEGDIGIFQHLSEIEDKIEELLPDVKKIIEQVKGDKGDTGIQGEQGIQGERGLDGNDGLDGKDGVDGKDGTNGKDGIDGLDGKDGEKGADGNIKELAPTEIRDSLELLVDDERLDKKAVRGITVSDVAPTNPQLHDIWIRLN